MSWQLGAFSLLALALGAGFAWYEHERPDARVVALVGTLAAFAALGRIAFAALPNVKPTTDIVLIAGFALGGGPGFAVGALAALTSNFFFGQGPWTPWQMAAWGATGVLGAALAWVAAHRRGGGPPRIGRWPLAIACCAAGFVFTVLQDFGDWVTYSDHSLVQLSVYVGRGLAFDAVHAAGCLAFALAFGPALTRSIQRFARRLTVTWIRPGPPASLPAIVIALALSGALGLRTPDAARAASSPSAYLLAAQNADGGFGAAPGQPSAELYSGWAALGLASAGYDLQRVQRGRVGLISYVGAGGVSAGDVGSLERTILVTRAAGLSPRDFGGRDLAAELARRVLADGSVGEQVNLTSFAVLAFEAAGIQPGPRMLRWLEHQQGRDGGFSFAGAAAGSDVDDTGAALEALAAGGGAGASARVRAVAYLRGQQNRDGGFPSQPGADSNAQSTAWAVQGIEAVHGDPGSLRRDGSVSPLAYLRSLIAPDGHVRYSRGTDQTPVWVTGQALMALQGKPLPLVPPPMAPAASPPAHRPTGTRSPAPRDARTRSSRLRLARRPEARRLRPAAGAGLHRTAPASPGRAGFPHVLIAALAMGAGLATALVLAPLGLG